ncbi:MAG: TldE/PmbA family protein [Candidatus Eisenbacteria bacterium]|nr:TldE/PmbA family protein [Candidatus Eisenbacteria bacterium]
MQEYFHGLADHVTSLLQGDEVATMNFSGEASDFVRFNHNAVRQAGVVQAQDLSVDLIRGARHAESTTVLCGIAEEDQGRLAAMIDELRARLEHVPEDPYLLYATEVQSTERMGENQLGPVEEALQAILEGGHGQDLVGIYAQGPIYRGFANSLGQRNWFSTHSFNLDWSLYLRDDKAVKSLFAGFAWEPQRLREKMESAVQQLDLLAQPAKTIEPGKYRVYLSPTALGDVAGTVGWGGFGLKSHRSKISSLLRMIEGDARFDEAVTLRENTAEGIAPNFDGKGFLKPDEVVLVEKGEFREHLVSARSAKEYGVASNGADAYEMPNSLDMSAGDVPSAEILERLGTGAYVNNLHYLNYSDRPACRITGMTRFATFWVEDGKVVAPLNVMRFDESVYRMLGENLIGLTQEREMLISSETYMGRSCESMRLPGALIDNFSFTL